MSIHITSRDLHIIQLISEWGYCSLQTISQQFNLTTKRTYTIMLRLVKAGLVVHERIFHAKPGIYRLSAQGAEGTGFQPLPRVALAAYTHHLKLLDLYFSLKNKYPEATWITERQLKHERYKKGFGQQGHVADGLLVFPSNKKIAIELELSLKSQARLEAIIKSYRADFSIEEVWYFCPEPIYSRLIKMSEKMPHMKVTLLQEVLT